MDEIRLGILASCNLSKQRICIHRLQPPRNTFRVYLEDPLRQVLLPGPVLQARLPPCVRNYVMPVLCAFASSV